MRSGVYKILNVSNGKFYLGSSADVDDRWFSEHRSLLRSGTHDNPKLQHAWNFHGEKSFTLELVENVEPDKHLLLEREQHYLDKWQPYLRGKGYNICPTAFGGDNFTHHPDREKIRKRLSRMFSGKKNPMFGQHHSSQVVHRQKTRAVGRYTLEWFIKRNGETRGRRLYQERVKMLRNRKINYSFDNRMRGTKRGPMTNEIKKRISERKLKMRQIRSTLHADIVSGSYTINQLVSKYGISKPTILRERRKLRQKEPRSEERGFEC